MIGRGGATDARQLAISLHRGRRGIASRPRVWFNHVRATHGGSSVQPPPTQGRRARGGGEILPSMGH